MGAGRGGGEGWGHRRPRRRAQSRSGHFSSFFPQEMPGLRALTSKGLFRRARELSGARSAARWREGGALSFPLPGPCEMLLPRGAEEASPRSSRRLGSAGAKTCPLRAGPAPGRKGCRCGERGSRVSGSRLRDALGVLRVTLRRARAGGLAKACSSGAIG